MERMTQIKGTPDFSESLAGCVDQNELLETAAKHFKEFGARALAIFDFTSETPLYSTLAGPLAAFYRINIGLRRDPAVRMAVRTGQIVSVRQHFEGENDNPHCRRFISIAADSGTVDAAGVVISSLRGKPYYVALGLSKSMTTLSDSDASLIHFDIKATVRGLSRFQIASARKDLTKRETEVLRHLALGLTDKETARALCVAPSTVRTLADRCLVKLNVGTRIEAVIAAAQSDPMMGI